MPFLPIPIGFQLAEERLLTYWQILRALEYYPMMTQSTGDSGINNLPDWRQSMGYVKCIHCAEEILIDSQFCPFCAGTQTQATQRLDREVFSVVNTDYVDTEVSRYVMSGLLTTTPQYWRGRRVVASGYVNGDEWLIIVASGYR